MKIRFQASIRIASVALVLAGLLAGCSAFVPPNIPRTGAGTPTATAAAVGSTDTPVPAPTTTAAPPTATIPASTATSAPPAPTNTPAAVIVPTNTPGAGQSSSIPLPSQRQPIQFASNTTSAVVTTNLQSGVVQAYQVNAQNGQHMYITIDGAASLSLYDPNLVSFVGIITATNPAKINLTETGNYYIALRGAGPVTMSVYIPALGADWTIPAPIPADLTPIQFSSGATSASFSANLVNGTPSGYSIAAQAGQQMTVTTGGGAVAFLFGQDHSWVPTSPAPTHQWIFPLPKTQTYWLVLLGNSPANVTVSIPAASVPQTGGQGTPVPLPGSSQRVTFGAGNASATINATLTTGQPQAYVLNIQAGQTLYVSTTGSVDVTIYGPGNTALTSGHSDTPNRWSVKASQTGDYIFAIAGNGASKLTFYVPPQ